MGRRGIVGVLLIAAAFVCRTNSLTVKSWKLATTLDIVGKPMRRRVYEEDRDFVEALRSSIPLTDAFLWERNPCHSYLFSLGAQKGGTTSLFEYIRSGAHPSLLANPTKEYGPMMFSRVADNETLVDYVLQQYASMNVSMRNVSAPRHDLACLSGTPLMLPHPFAPQRTAWGFPNATYVALLRNPVERAYSQFRMEFSRGTEERTFAEVVVDEITMLHACQRNVSVDELPSWAEDSLDYCATTHLFPGLPGSYFVDTVAEPGAAVSSQPFSVVYRGEGFPSLQSRGYVAYGLYYYHLRRWLEFLPTNRLMVVNSTTFRTQQGRVLAEILHALPINATGHSLRTELLDVWYVPQSHVPIEPALQEMLHQGFEMRKTQYELTVKHGDKPMEFTYTDEGGGLRRENVAMAKSMLSRFFEQQQTKLASLNIRII